MHETTSICSARELGFYPSTKKDRGTTPNIVAAAKTFLREKREKESLSITLLSSFELLSVMGRERAQSHAKWIA